MTRLLICTRNPHKFLEFSHILTNTKHQLLALTNTDLDPHFDIAETGETFEQNATLKVQGFAAALPKQNLTQAIPIPQPPTTPPTANNSESTFLIADDSGLVVDALQGRPGIYSKRYANTDSQRIARLLSELQHIPPHQRTARFVCAMALLQLNTHTLQTVEGSIEGSIGFQPQGKSGFGYDPVFIPNSGDGRTLAQLGPEFKNQHSHRAQALAQIKSLLQS